MLGEDNITGLIAILTGVILFKTLTYFEGFEGFLREYKMFIIIGVLFIYFKRKELTQKFKKVK
jgi:hypothetical protein